MNDPVKIANNAQTRASDPDVSAWVSANAGSGKTHVLVNRVIRLMLTGTPPEKILCLTYTRAAAAEMSSRLYERLAEWIPLGDDELIDIIHNNTGHAKFSKEQLAEPRRLFARALETPGGLKIQTIHAFCEQLLHRFPLEAGITSGFKVMDDREAKELRTRIRANFFTEIETDNDAEIKTYLAEVIKYSGGQKSFDELLEKLLEKRDEFEEAYKYPEQHFDRLCKALELERHETIDSAITQAVNETNLVALAGAKQILEQRSAATDRKQGTRIDRLLRSKSVDEKFSLLRDLTLISNGKQKSDRSLCTQKCATDNQEVLQILRDEAVRIEQCIEKINAISLLHATNAALHIGRLITLKYEAEKKRLGFYDYHDLIAKVLTMFAEMPDAAWVLYKLDGGLDHILIDEAQDTSPAQWEIIRFLADEFFSGSGVRDDLNRSIFAVGDRKQSIYSFQGAAPASFDERKEYFAQAAQFSNKGFEAVDLQVSFRSTSQVLSLVDKIFEQPTAAKGVEETSHCAKRRAESGVVELWPVIEQTAREETDIWIPDSGLATHTPPRIRLAEKIARKIRYWLDSEEILESENRPIKPDDILILVRNRTQMMAALVRALKLAGIPVAGVDRLKLTRHIGVQDLMALARFVLLPEDDLNFAGLLKSSLLEKDDGSPINDDDLLNIAAERGEISLWKAFSNFVADGAPFSKSKQLLETWKLLASELLPFEFFSSVLNTGNRRAAILTRLGSEAGEPLDAFLLLAQDFEQNNIPCLQGFLDWIENGETEIKREMEKNDGEVRIMTVHGSKGLESNIVILPDTYDVPDRKHLPSFLNVCEGTPLWRLTAAFETPLTEQLKQKCSDENLEEYNRLFYVAMTRARDRLYIGAAQSRSTIKDHSWYQLVWNVLAREENRMPDPVFDYVWRISGDVTSSTNEENRHSPSGAEAPVLPAWIYKNPSTGKTIDRWVAPSRLGEKEQTEPRELHLSPLAGTANSRFIRGNLIHKMLQYLPSVPEKDRELLASRFLESNGSSLTAKERQETLEETLNLLTDERFAAIFSADSIAEAPIVARLRNNDGKEMVINGQIDRLHVGSNIILIIDYKTNKPPPASIAAVNPQYIRQLAGYRLALRQLYPNHRIRAGLLWTHNAVLMEINEKQLINVLPDRISSRPLT